MSIPGIVKKNDDPQTYEELFAKINPNKDALVNLAVQKDESPMIMLNFLRFRPRGDMSIYSLYGKDAAPQVAKTGSMIYFYGKALMDLDPSYGFSPDWDGIVMPIYKRRHSFLELQQNPIYQRAIPYRTAGTYARLLYVVGDSDTLVPESKSIAESFRTKDSVDVVEGEVFVAELVRFKKIGGREKFIDYIKKRKIIFEKYGAEIVLSRSAETAIVSEDVWNHLMLTKYQDVDTLKDVYESQDWKNIESLRDEALEDISAVACNGVPLPK